MGKDRVRGKAMGKDRTRDKAGVRGKARTMPHMGPCSLWSCSSTLIPVPYLRALVVCDGSLY